jgi:hypothetical protein
MGADDEQERDSIASVLDIRRHSQVDFQQAGDRPGYSSGVQDLGLSGYIKEC